MQKKIYCKKCKWYNPSKNIWKNGKDCFITQKEKNYIGNKIILQMSCYENNKNCDCKYYISEWNILEYFGIKL